MRSPTTSRKPEIPEIRGTLPPPNSNFLPNSCDAGFSSSILPELDQPLPKRRVHQIVPTEADAVIFVTSFDSPLGREGLEFLQKVREHVRKVFFVVNKLDIIAPGNASHVMAFIRNRLSTKLAFANHVFSLSRRWSVSKRKLPAQPRN